MADFVLAQQQNRSINKIIHPLQNVFTTHFEKI